MTPTLADAALFTPLAAFTTHDVATRSIPIWLTFPAFILLMLGAALNLWTWYPLSSVIGFFTFRLANLPAGDQKAMAVCAGFLLPGWACFAVVLSLAAGFWLMVLGRWRDWRTPEWPFFPWVAASVLAARMLSA